MISLALKYCLVIVSSYSFIDASTGDYQEEEVFNQEEEEENFDQYTNQGKLYSCKLIFLLSAKLYKSKAPPLFTLCLMIPSQVLLYKLYCFWFIKVYFLIHDSLGLE